MTVQAISYASLLRRNPSFRRFWYGQIVSQLGDWFDSIALYTLTSRLTGSGQALGALLIAQYFTTTLIGPFAGVLVDRYSRRRLMIAADLARALMVLLFLLVRTPSDVWLIYVVVVFKFALTSVFEPARNASIPALAAPEELVAANGLSSMTWAVMLAIGAALGGLVSGTLGVNLAFLLDSLSFLLSAVLIASVKIPETPLGHRKSSGGLSQIREGFQYILAKRDVTLYATTKALWHLGTGVLVLLMLFGRTVFPLGKDGALSIGLLYAARGVGQGLGPLLSQRFSGSMRFMRRAIGPAFLLTAIGYTAFSTAPTLPLALCAVVIAHTGGGLQWVFSTTLLHLSVPNYLLGRVFAIELALLTLTTSISTYAVAFAADAGLTPRTLAMIMGATFLPSSIALTALLWRSPAVGTVTT